MSTATNTAVAPTLPDTLRLGPVSLTISDLDRSIGFYEDILGLQLRVNDGAGAALGTGGEDLVRLVEEPGAASGGRHAGLFHFALLYPSRSELARAVMRLASTSTPIEGASDHGVSEAIYLRDPDNNGIELYVDRPREQWPSPRGDGDRIEMYTIALDMKSLLESAAGKEGPEAVDPGLRMGHLHLHVGDVERGLGFYRDVLGFEVMVNIGSAAFVSAGGYHHHLGFNVWLGRDVQPLPPRTAGLREWNVVLDDGEQIAAVRARVAAAGLDADGRDGGFLVRDPWRTAVVFTTTAGR